MSPADTDRIVREAENSQREAGGASGVDAGAGAGGSEREAGGDAVGVSGVSGGGWCLWVCAV